MRDLKIIYQGQKINVEILSYSPRKLGKTSGPPENCYPAEDAYVEFDISTGNDLLDQLLMENHENELTELVIDKIERQ